jgi:hypothetical protein
MQVPLAFLSKLHQSHWQTESICCRQSGAQVPAGMHTAQHKNQIIKAPEVPLTNLVA